MQEAAEDAVREYEYDHRLMLHQVNYINMNDNDNSDEEEEGDVEDGEEQWDDGEGDGEQWGDFEISEHFGGQQVLYQTSGVQVPIEIYEGCKWTMERTSSPPPTFVSTSLVSSARPPAGPPPPPPQKKWGGPI